MIGTQLPWWQWRKREEETELKDKMMNYRWKMRKRYER